MTPLEQQAMQKKERLLVAGQVVKGMAVAFKNFAIYPSKHSICLQSLKTLNLRLRNYLEAYGDLRFSVNESSLSLDDEVVHRDHDDQARLAALFYRDGIKWFEFQSGINSDEVRLLLTILKENLVQPEETAGDIVTALWEENLPHFGYEAVDFIFDGEGETTDPISLKSAPAEAVIKFGEPLGAGDGAAAGLADYEKISERLRRHYNLELNLAEQEALKLMVLAEEGKNIDQDVLDILLITLDEQREEEIFTDILSFVKEEILYGLGVGEFQDVFHLLKNLRKYQIRYRQEKPWAARLLKDFFQEISTPETVAVLEDVLTAFDDPNYRQELRRMGQLFQLLDPAIIPALAGLLAKGYSKIIEIPLQVAIHHLAVRDVAPLGKLLFRGEAVLLVKLIPVLGSLKGEKGEELLYISLERQEEQVRIKALEKLAFRGTRLKGKYYKLVDDPNRDIRRLTLGILGAERSELAESFLLDYLANCQYSTDEAEHIYACFRALGSCGSGRSLAYLSKTLTEGAWKSLVGIDKTVLRNGAAQALSLLDNPKAKLILQEGLTSKYDSVKDACNLVLKGD